MEGEDVGNAESEAEKDAEYASPVRKMCQSIVV